MERQRASCQCFESLFKKHGAHSAEAAFFDGLDEYGDATWHNILRHIFTSLSKSYEKNLRYSINKASTSTNPPPPHTRCKKRVRQEVKLCEKTKLVHGCICLTTIPEARFIAGLCSILQSVTKAKPILTDNILAPKCFHTKRSYDLIEEGEDVKPIFLSSGLSKEQEESYMNYLKECKMFLRGLILKCLCRYPVFVPLI